MELLVRNKMYPWLPPLFHICPYLPLSCVLIPACKLLEKIKFIFYKGRYSQVHVLLVLLLFFLENFYIIICIIIIIVITILIYNLFQHLLFLRFLLSDVVVTMDIFWILCMNSLFVRCMCSIYIFIVSNPIMYFLFYEKNH